MATVAEALSLIKKFAPEEYEFKKEYDNIGLTLGSPDAQVKKILCCLDVTGAVVDEAIETGADLIISHHPLVWFPLKNVTDETVQGRLLLKAARAGLNIYAAHTNLDFCKDGINDYVANAIGLRNIKPIDPYISGDVGFGRIGDLANKVYVTVLKGEVENVLKDNHVRIIGEPMTLVKRIAVINGGGGSDTGYIDAALKMGADCLVTADVKHHFAIYARESGLTVIEPQHFNMEHVYITRLVQILKLEAKSGKVSFEVVQSERETNPRF